MKILPCPFCGNYIYIKWKLFPNGIEKCAVECAKRFSTCPVNLRTHYCNTIEAAIELWNTRNKISSTKGK